MCTFYSILLSREINLKVQSQYNVRARERLPEKIAKFLEIGCDEIPVPFAVLQGYWVVQNLHFVIIFERVVQIAIIGDWVLHVVLPLTSCNFCFQILSVYERSIEGFFFLFWLFLLRVHGNLLIYTKNINFSSFLERPIETSRRNTASRHHDKWLVWG